jgi:hypothetical protein
LLPGKLRPTKATILAAICSGAACENIVGLLEKTGSVKKDEWVQVAKAAERRTLILISLGVRDRTDQI